MTISHPNCCFACNKWRKMPQIRWNIKNSILSIAHNRQLFGFFSPQKCNVKCAIHLWQTLLHSLFGNRCRWYNGEFHTHAHIYAQPIGQRLQQRLLVWCVCIWRMYAYACVYVIVLMDEANLYKIISIHTHIEFHIFSLIINKGSYKRNTMLSSMFDFRSIRMEWWISQFSVKQTKDLFVL